MSAGAERLRPRPRGTGVGTVITGIAGSVSVRAFPLLLDLGFDVDVARSAAGGIGAARGARAAPLLLDLGIDVDAARAAAGGPGAIGGSAPLLLDLAGFADSARFDSNLDVIGVGSIFGAWSPLGTDAGLLFIASALFSLFLIGSMPAGGGGGPGGGGPFALISRSPFFVLTYLVVT